MAARILIVDDHPLTREALSSLLRAHGFDVAGEAPDGADGGRRGGPPPAGPRAARPLDARHRRPRRRSRSSARPRPSARSSCSPPPAPRTNLLAAIRGGAAGYLLKTEPPERIAGFLEGVANGEAALSGSIARRLLDAGARPATAAARACPTRSPRRSSARELEVLLLLDDHLGTDEIAERLFISEHTVRSHVKSLLRKLGVSSRREALERLAFARAA